MTDQERQQAFLAEYEALRIKYGFDWQAYVTQQKLTTETGGIAYQTVIERALMPVPNWQPPMPEPETSGKK